MATQCATVHCHTLVAWTFAPWQYEMHGDDIRLNTFAVRKTGGSSLAWGAVCPRFLENDFRLDSLYGVGMDWPVSYSDLEGDYLDISSRTNTSQHAVRIPKQQKNNILSRHLYHTTMLL